MGQKKKGIAMSHFTTVTGMVDAIGQRRELGKAKTPMVTLVVEEGGKYPSPVPVECWGDLADEAEGCAVGDAVEVDAYVRGREYNGRYYASLKAAAIRLPAGEARRRHDRAAEDENQDAADGAPF